MKLEWLILADFAQLVGNKLYLAGGGWDVLTVNTEFPFQQFCGVAASFLIPWNETNQRHAVEIDIATEDGQTLAKIAGEIEAGRPPGMPPGQEQRAQLAGNLLLIIERPGNYAITARVEGQAEGRISFSAVAGPLLNARQG